MPLPDFEFKKTIEGKNNIEQQTLAEVLHKEKELNNVKITTKAGSIIYSTDIQFVEGDTHLTTKPAGSNGEIQFNDNGSFGSASAVSIETGASANLSGQWFPHTLTDQDILKAEAIKTEFLFSTENTLRIETSSSTSAKGINIMAGESSASSGADINIYAGDVNVSSNVARAGDVSIWGGEVNSATGTAEGGNIYFYPGGGYGAGKDAGHFSVWGGHGSDVGTGSDGSDIEFYSGGGQKEGWGGWFMVFCGSGGSSGGAGGSIYLSAGTGGGTGNGGDVILQRGLKGSGEGSVEGRVKCFGTLEVGRFTNTGFFFNLSRMTGDEADARTDDENGSMYYRTDDDAIRVKVGGTWKTITVS